MKSIIFLSFLVLHSFHLLGQYNPEKLNTLRIGSSYGGFSGIEFHIGLERNITPRQSFYGSVFTSSLNGRGFYLGYKYNVISYKWIQAFAGLDARTEYFGKIDFKGRSFFTIEPTVEFRFNVNKSYFISTGFHFNSIINNKRNYYEFSGFLNRFNLGVARRF